MPAVSDDGKTLVYVGLHAPTATTSTRCRIDPARFLPRRRRAGRAPRPARRARATSRSAATATTRSRPRAAQLPAQHRARQLRAQRDHLHARAAATSSAIHDVSASLSPSSRTRRPPTSTLDYCYGRLPVDFTLHLFHSVVPRQRLQSSTTRRTSYDETRRRPHHGRLVHAPGGLRPAQHRPLVHRRELQGRPPSRRGARSVRAAPGRAAAAATSTSLHVGYGFSNVEGSLDAAGRGARASRSASAPTTRRRYTGSTYTVRGLSGGLTGYVPMPWPGHHTLALRVGGRRRRRQLPAGRRVLRRRLRSRQQQPARRRCSPASSTARSCCAATRRASTPASEYVLEQRRVPLPHRYAGPRHLHAAALPPPHRRQRLRRLRRRLRLPRPPRASASSTHGALIDTTQLHASMGAELWLGCTLGYVARYRSSASATPTASAPRRSRTGSRTSSPRARSDAKLRRAGARTCPGTWPSTRARYGWPMLRTAALAIAALHRARRLRDPAHVRRAPRRVGLRPQHRGPLRPDGHRHRAR